ncbi:ATP-dependent DNA helicase RecG domain protein [Candidatus Vecturithrix granuli]|uniref:ATP-dependent DNA helicase RecG domain protein n=1 Tax=Vecturithrix granuli TaxID=1499967 RepID=A0A081C6D0_VECG1|nr:ATP-dependent DNA helicase RecG domain protein [Candidatus Vecturithrix granuli]
MKKTEVLEILRNGENSGVEFKRDSIDNAALAKELVALSNAWGGYIFLGVDDQGIVVGLTRPNLEEWVMTTCRDKIRPEIIPYFEILQDVVPGKNIAIIKVERGWTVHHRWHNNHRTYYLRVGSESREASQEELGRLFQQRGAFRVETRSVSGSSLKDLDRERLEDYFGRVRAQEIPDYDDETSWRKLLVNTEMLSDESENYPCTIAGLLLFGKQPHRFLPQSAIEANAFSGVEKDYAAIERSTFRGPIVGLFRKKEYELTLVDPGLIEKALSFVRRNTIPSAKLLNGTVRVDIPCYPDDVIREAVVNAIVHRDYLLSATDIELMLYANRLEIISPGQLPNGVTVEKMKTGCRAARNQLLKDVLRDYGYMEHIGMGIPRKIIKGMKAHNGTEPELIAGEEEFLLRLSARSPE